MRKIIAAVFAFTLIAALSACSSDMPELKSPCVGIEGSPCEKQSPEKNTA